jgi:hypothetical protein
MQPWWCEKQRDINQSRNVVRMPSANNEDAGSGGVDAQGADGSEQSIWDINPLKTSVELSDGKISMSESAVYNGRVRVSQAVDTSVGDPECAWMYIQAESRDGADVTLTVDQAIELRDALDACIEQFKSGAGGTGVDDVE